MPEADRPAPRNTPLTALARRWWLAVLFAVVFGAAGAGYSAAQPTTYIGEARVAVGSGSLDARAVAGYTTGATQLASDISRYVNDQQAQTTVSTIVGEDVADDVKQVIASPIAGSSVIRIEVQATSESSARTAAQAVAKTLSDQVNATTGASSEQLLNDYTALSAQVATATQAVADAKANLDNLTGRRAEQAVLDQARAGVESATAALDVLQVRQLALSQQYRNSVVNVPAASGLRIVMEGRLAGSDASSRMQKYALAGVAAGILLSLVVAVWLDRRDAQRTARASTPAVPAGAGPSGGSTLDVDRAADVDSVNRSVPGR